MIYCGVYDDKFLSNVSDFFEKHGVGFNKNKGKAIIEKFKNHKIFSLSSKTD